MQGTFDDLKCLFPEKHLVFNGVLLSYRPYSIKRLFSAIEQFKTLISFLEQKDIPRQRLFSWASFPTVFEVLYPFVSSQISYVFHIENPEDLLVEHLLFLFSKIVEINIESKELFEAVLDELNKRNKKGKAETIDLSRVIQELVRYGHSWKSICNYTLAEIGVFLKAVVEQKHDDSAEMLSNAWMGSNLSKQGYMEVLKSMQSKPEKKELSQEGIDKNWRRLAALASQLN